MSAASRPGLGALPPCPRLGPAPPSRGPFPEQGPAAAAGRAPCGGRAGVCNGSMLPAASAAPGQAGSPARPQPPRSHQLQLQLGALWLPQPPAALTGNRLRRLGGSLFCLFPAGFTSATPPVFAFHPRPSIAHCLGISRLTPGFESFLRYSGLFTLSPPAFADPLPPVSNVSPSDPPPPRSAV